MSIWDDSWYTDIFEKDEDKNKLSDYSSYSSPDTTSYGDYGGSSGDWGAGGPQYAMADQQARYGDYGGQPQQPDYSSNPSGYASDNRGYGQDYGAWSPQYGSPINNDWSRDLAGRGNVQPWDSGNDPLMQRLRRDNEGAASIYGNTPEGAYQWMLSTGENPDFAKQMAMYHYGIGNPPDMAKSRENQNWLKQNEQQTPDQETSPEMQKCQSAIAKAQAGVGTGTLNLDAQKDVEDACGGMQEITSNPQMMRQLSYLSKQGGKAPVFWQGKMKDYAEGW